MIGKLVSHYKIIKKIGSGGMGEIFLAEDTELGRYVALKFLTPNFYDDKNIKQRFIQEAKSASALQHNNICTIHEIGHTDDDKLFICMDYYEGQSLQDFISNNVPDEEKIINIVLQISAGLKAAHDKHIIHSDIKPANIFITKNDTVKILDFGLAKTNLLNERNDESSTEGTVAYMSPEQLKGEEINKQTDIWAIGVLLYEMLTGVNPFSAEYEQAISYKIMNDEVGPPTHLNKKISEKWDAIINNLLAKNPENRYKDISEFINDIKHIQNDDLDAKQLQYGHKPNSLLNKIILLLFILIITAALSYTTYNYFQYDYMQLEFNTPLQITGEKGLEINMVISPDGKKIAYESGPLFFTEIFIKDLNLNKIICISKELSGLKSLPKWSYDSQNIAFEHKGKIYNYRIADKDLKILVDVNDHGYAHSIAFSPSSEHIAYIRRDTIYRRSLTQEDEIAIGAEKNIHSLNWSPNCEWLAFVKGAGSYIVSDNSLGNFNPSSISIINTEDFSIKEILNNGKLNISPVWLSDSRSILFVSNINADVNIYQVNIDTEGNIVDDIQQISSAFEPHTISISNNNILVYSEYERKLNLRSIKIPTTGITSIDKSTGITNWNYDISGFDVLNGNDRIAVACNMNGQYDIYTISKTTGKAEQITNDKYIDYFPAWSPNGKEIAYHSMRNSKRDIFSISADTKMFARNPVIIDTSNNQTLSANWSPDGNSIIYYQFGESVGIKKVSRESPEHNWSKPVYIFDKFGGHPRYSPDGKTILFMRNRAICTMPANGGEYKVLLNPSTLGNVRIVFPEWSVDGKKIYFRVKENDKFFWEFWELNLENMKTTKVISIDDEDEQIDFGFFRVDSENIYFIKAEYDSDIWEINLNVK